MKKLVIITSILFVLALFLSAVFTWEKTVAFILTFPSTTETFLMERFIHPKLEEESLSRRICESDKEGYLFYYRYKVNLRNNFIRAFKSLWFTDGLGFYSVDVRSVGISSARGGGPTTLNVDLPPGDNYFEGCFALTPEAISVQRVVAEKPELLIGIGRGYLLGPSKRWVLPSRVNLDRLEVAAANEKFNQVVRRTCGEFSNVQKDVCIWQEAKKDKNRLLCNLIQNEVYREGCLKDSDLSNILIN